MSVNVDAHDWDRREAQLHVFDGSGRVIDIVGVCPGEPVKRLRDAVKYIAEEAAAMEDSRVELIVVASDGKQSSPAAVTLAGVPPRCRLPRPCVDGIDLVAHVLSLWERE